VPNLKRDSFLTGVHPSSLTAPRGRAFAGSCCLSGSPKEIFPLEAVLAPECSAAFAPLANDTAVAECALPASPQVILSFDVEEHDRIEAAAGLCVAPELKAHYRQRLEPSTRWILEQLDDAGAKATFFIVGEIAEHNPGLIRAIHRAGHEVASHGWDHRRVLTMTPDEFRRDLRQSKDALEQVTGEEVAGYRAPTFSITRATPWAIDVLAEEGFRYDSSIYPVRHDRYGVPGAPRGPFLARGNEHSILELPPATLRLFGINLPMGGGGYFRLFPLLFTRWAVRQLSRCANLATLYFHPWEFDIEQMRLPLKKLSAFRTYVGISRTQRRLAGLMGSYRLTRAMDAVKRMKLAVVS
jgi:polysaccharide deacetylase family protein (PEP-CTERM system associated)